MALVLLLAALAAISAASASTSIMDASVSRAVGGLHDKLGDVTRHAGHSKSEPRRSCWPSGRSTHPRGLNNDDDDDVDNIDATSTLAAASAWRRHDDNNDNNANLDNANENDNYYDSSNHNGPRLPTHSGRLVGPAKRAPPNEQDHDKLAPDKIDKDLPARPDWFQADQLGQGLKWAPRDAGRAPPAESHSDHVRLAAPEVATRRDRSRPARGAPLFGRRGSAEKRRSGAALAAAASVAALDDANALPAPQGCPRECACNWKNGKQFADCSARTNKLARLPVGLDPLTQVLNLSANHPVHLPQETFTSLQLNNLQRIYLSG